MSYLPYDGGDEYTDPDGAGLDGAGGGGGHSDWPENRKLKAIRNVKAKATQARTDLTEGWTMSTQTIPSAMGSGDSITVEGIVWVDMVHPSVRSTQTIPSAMGST